MTDNAFHDDVRFRVLRAVQSNPNLTHKGLAKELRVSAGSVNYCLRALVDKGLVKVENFRTSKNRLGYLYKLTPHGIAEKAALTGRFLRRKMVEYEALRAEIEAVSSEAGEGSAGDPETIARSAQ
jgi:EPS-associated MarR family transcriptional regulator